MRDVHNVITLKLRDAGGLLLADCLLNTVWCLSASPGWVGNALLVGDIATVEITEERIVRDHNSEGEAVLVSNIAGKFGKRRTMKTGQA